MLKVVTFAFIILASAGGASAASVGAFGFALEATEGSATATLVNTTIPLSSVGSLSSSPNLVTADVSFAISSDTGPYHFAGAVGVGTPWELTIDYFGLEAPTTTGTTVRLPFGTIDQSYLNPGGPGLLAIDIVGTLSFGASSVPFSLGPSAGGPACGGFVRCYGLDAQLTMTADSLVITNVNSFDNTYAPGGFNSPDIGTIEGVTFRFTKLGFIADRLEFVPEPYFGSLLGVAAAVLFLRRMRSILLVTA